MPIPPPSPQIWDTAYSIMNASKSRLHERMPSLVAFKGSILKETQASTQQSFNNAYRKTQAVMANAGSSTFDAKAYIPGIPPVSPSALDPSTECWISWFGCSDGVNQYTTPALPTDMLTPYWMSERLNGSMQQFPSPRKPNMPLVPDGLPYYQKTNKNGCAEWRGEVIYYPGSLQSMDFLIRYQKRFPDLNDVGSEPWFEQDVPVAQIQEPLSYFLCKEICMSLSNDPDIDANLRQQLILGVAYFDDQAMKAVRLLVSPDKKRKQRINVSRLPFAGGGQGGGFSGQGTCGPAYTGS